MIVLPAFAALYLALDGIWDLPAEDKVVATTVALATFLGVFLQISTNRWNNSEAKYDGELAVVGNDPETGIPELKMTIKRHPDELAEKRTVRLRSVDRRVS